MSLQFLPIFHCSSVPSYIFSIIVPWGRVTLTKLLHLYQKPEVPIMHFFSQYDVHPVCVAEDC